MKVLEVIKGLNRGGSEQLLVSRVSASSRTRFTYIVAYLDPNATDLVDTLKASLIETVCIGQRKFWPLHLRRLIREVSPDVVHIHSPRIAAVGRILIKMLPKKQRPRVVTTQHSVKYHWISSWATRLTNFMDDATIAVSHAVAESPICAGASFIETIVHGVDLSNMESYRLSASRTIKDFALGDQLRVVSVANFRTEKRHDLILEVAQDIVRKRDNVDFYLVGSGPLEGSIREQVAKLALDKRVHFLGLVPEAARITAAAHVFLLTSDFEGMPVSVMEALACGIPVVARRVGGLPQLIKHGVTGLLVADDATQLRNALETLLDDETLRQTMGCAALEAVRELDISETRKRIESLYMVLKGRSA